MTNFFSEQTHRLCFSHDEPQPQQSLPVLGIQDREGLEFDHNDFIDSTPKFHNNCQYEDPNLVHPQ
jgi:hypothetical protein